MALEQSAFGAVPCQHMDYVRRTCLAPAVMTTAAYRADGAPAVWVRYAPGHMRPGYAGCLIVFSGGEYPQIFWGKSAADAFAWKRA